MERQHISQSYIGYLICHHSGSLPCRYVGIPIAVVSGLTLNMAFSIYIPYRFSATYFSAMMELKKKPLFNPEGDPDVRLRRMIGGNTTNLNDFNNMKYAWVSDWYRQAMNNFWIPEEINLSQDVKDYPRLLSAERTSGSPSGLKRGFFFSSIMLSSMTSSFRSPRPQGPCCGHSKWS